MTLQAHRGPVRAEVSIPALAELSLAVDESEITWRKRPGLKAIERLLVVPSR